MYVRDNQTRMIILACLTMYQVGVLRKITIARCALSVLNRCETSNISSVCYDCLPITQCINKRMRFVCAIQAITKAKVGL